LARLEYSTSAPDAPRGSVTFVLDRATVAFPLEGIVDLPSEAARLAKDIAKLEADAKKIDAKLGNAEFVAKAPDEVVEEQRERRDEALATVQKLAAALAQIRSAI
jgi:valyl-tRNA synthetase